MKYLLDTNILIHYIRQSSLGREVDSLYLPFVMPNEPFVSVVSIGELKSIARQNQWGNRKVATMELFLSKMLKADINVETIIETYAEIDAYSQNKLPTRPLPLTARNMGKNDLWIAATASVLGATLLTTDTDFDHLNGVFLPVAKISA